MSGAPSAVPLTVQAQSPEVVQEPSEPEPTGETTEAGLPENFLIEFGDQNDWIQFKAGEWLKGELKRMRQKEVEFKSKKLKLMTFRWRDIVQVQARKIKTFVFEGNIVETGTAMITKEEVIVQTQSGLKTYPRSALVSIVRGEPRERNYWSTRLRVGLSGAAGNSSNLSFNAFWRLMRTDARSRTLISYEGTIGGTSEEQTVNRQIGNAEVNVYISRRLYVTPLVAQLLNDRFQNLRLRATPSATAGVYLFDKRKLEWNLDGGLGYQYTNLLSVAEGAKDPRHDGSVTMGTFLKWRFIPDNRMELEWRTNLVYTQLGLTNHTGIARLNLKVTSILRLTTEFMYLRTESPPPREDGTAPRSNDYQLVLGMTIKINE
jgi:hypothetical protein